MSFSLQSFLEYYMGYFFFFFFKAKHKFTYGVRLSLKSKCTIVNIDWEKSMYWLYYKKEKWNVAMPQCSTGTPNSYLIPSKCGRSRGNCIGEKILNSCLWNVQRWQHWYYQVISSLGGVQASRHTGRAWLGLIQELALVQVSKMKQQAQS